MPVQKTSISVYSDQRENLDNLQDLTLHELKQFYIEHRFYPTYNELQKFMVRRNEKVTWRTQIQPRLTNELVKQNKVVQHGKRKCRVAKHNKQIETWRPVNL